MVLLAQIMLSQSTLISKIYEMRDTPCKCLCKLLGNCDSSS